MSGEKLINKLKELNIPGADKLDPSEYDWIFLDDEDSSPLNKFLHWFIQNMHSGSLLSTEELKQYDELSNSGKVLSGQQLDDVAFCLATLPSDDKFTDFSNKDNSLIQEDIDNLEDQLQKLILRRDHLNLHKLELKSELLDIKDRIKTKESSLQQVQQLSLITSASHDKALVELSETLDNLAAFFKHFTSVDDSAVFLSQLNLEEWHETEKTFQTQLQNYINKQFKEGVKDVARQEDHNEYQLLEAGNLDLQLVRGADEEEYQINVTELNRLSQMMEVSEHMKVKAEVNLSRKKAEVEEAEKIMNQVLRSQIPSSLELLQLNINEVKETRKLVLQELGQQMDNILQLSSQVSQSETTHTISGNYQVKLQRQEYFLQKQNFVAEQLISQLTRYDWLNIALDLEETLIDRALNVLSSINCLLHKGNVNYQQRMKILKDIQQTYEEEEVLQHLHPSISILKELTDSSLDQSDPDQKTTIINGIKTLDTAINSVKHQLDSLRDPHSNRLHKLNLKCKLLEECLFGDTGTLTNLPSSWLSMPVLMRLDKVNEEAWKFRQEMLSVIRKHEEKKKILEVQPSLKNESLKWADKFVK